MLTRKIAVFVGSLRKESINRMMANASAKFAPASLELEIIELGYLAMRNQDFDDEGRPPNSWTTFRQQVSAFDGVLFITPEYNRSMPAVLKNALDVASRPYGQSVWNGKPGAVISVSPSLLGGFGANSHLRQSLVALNVPCLAQPEVYIGNVFHVFDAGREFVNDKTREFLGKFMITFADWLEANAANTPSTTRKSIRAGERRILSA